MDKQYYYMGIKELVIPKDEPFEKIHDALNRFIDALPYLADELSENIRLMEYKTLADILETALPLITDIYKAAGGRFEFDRPQNRTDRIPVRSDGIFCCKPDDIIDQIAKSTIFW